MNNKISVIYTTIDTKQAAEELANKAIESRLAVCVNIIPEGISIYMWQGKVEQNSEYYMIFKSTNDKIEELESFILEHHPYDVPAILKLEGATSIGFFNYLTSNM